MALALSNVAFAELRLGKLSSAATSLRDALDTSMKIEAKTVVAFCLDVSVQLAVARGRMHEAARLAGAASGAQEELGSVRDPFDQSLFDHVVESIRASLGADADVEIQRGRELSLDEAAAIALAVTANQTDRVELSACCAERVVRPESRAARRWRACASGERGIA